MLTSAVIFICMCAEVLSSKDRGLNSPGYSEAKHLVQQTVEHLKLQALDDRPSSMLYLNNSRRHYLELLNVIDVAAKGQLGCVRLSYEDTYQILLNKSAVEGLSEPQKVKNKLNQLFNSVGQKIKYVVSMIDKFCKTITNSACDNMMDILIQVEPSKYSVGAKQLLLAGKASKIYSMMAPEFVSAAVSFNVHRYVIVSEERLKPLVLAVADLYRSLNVSAVGC